MDGVIFVVAPGLTSQEKAEERNRIVCLDSLTVGLFLSVGGKSVWM